MQRYTTTEAKTAHCAGCGLQFPVRELAEILEGSLEFPGTPLAFFEGERLCRVCYAKAA